MVKQAALALLVLAGPMVTAASAIPLHVGWGTTVVQVAPLPSRIAADVERRTGKHEAVGYKFQYVAVVGLDLWTWDGAFCVFEPATRGRSLSYSVIPRKLAEELVKDAGYPLVVPWAYRYPTGLALCALVLAIGIPAALIVRRIRSREGPPISLGVG